MRPAALAMLLLALCWWLYLEHVDPRYDGRRTSEWLRQLNSESDEDTEAAERAIFILGERAVPQIRKFFYANEPEWQRRLKERIEEHTGWELETDRDFEDNEAAGRAIEILARNALAIVPWLVETLDDEDWDYDSSRAIESIGPAAAPYLKDALRRNGRDEVRSHVVKLLFEQDYREIIPELKGCLRSDFPPLRAASLVALARFNSSPAETLKLIRPFLADTNDIVRAHAVEALGHLTIGDPQLLSEFLGFYRDSEEIVRARVVRRLGWACSLDPLAFDMLIDCLGDSSDHLRVRSLSHIVWMLDAADLMSRWGAFESVADGLHPNMWLPLPEVARNSEAVFARSDEILPKLMKVVSLTSHDIQNDWNTSRSMCITAMLLVDSRFRPHTQAILAETKKVVSIENPASGSSIDWDSILKPKKISGEGWLTISKHLNGISQVDPQMAKLVYARLLSRYQPPPPELTEVFKPW